MDRPITADGLHSLHRRIAIAATAIASARHTAPSDSDRSRKALTTENQESSDQRLPVIIVGGGLAGMATAEGLSRLGVPVLLLESRGRLGGRASSFDDPASGMQIDNCQHVSMGCCTNFRNFCEQTGIADHFRVEKCLNFVGPNGRVARFKASNLPAPFHLTPAFLRLQYLSFADRRSIARGLHALARPLGPDRRNETLLDWLRRHQQTDVAIDRFWHVVLVSALSESLDRIDVAYGRKVFVDGFLANRTGWQVEIPTVPLDDLYGESLLTCFDSRRAEIRTKTNVTALRTEGDRVTGVTLRDGTTIDASAVVLAVPHHRVDSLLTEPPLAEVGQSIQELESAPISSVHLWFDREITDLPHAVLIDRVSQWMFNRTQIASRNGQAAPTDESRFYYQIVISASRDVAGNHDELTRLVVEELSDIWPQVRSAKLLVSRVVTERRAVFSVTPGSDRLRPPQRTSVPGLYLAGDWTATGWPATMEGAVRSGYLAAEEILSDRDESDAAPKLLADDLPTALLSRWLFRLP
ncbi:hydroxysqualene dehydroxylase HpnE [Stratiformator vulcanicus]|uniref:15-cis-phytoene desaturase n=1 Tax=Stratiformator vulcanicus TaxID=2527980 RepID=A0A517R555_9PLAN|nr:hydroxysqualene dehydroxylase HpnE [Stratiformator vulcanicus]QDT38953.1 15-cis-phytoene desaturase [Stratiformator vulcanicus]